MTLLHRNGRAITQLYSLHKTVEAPRYLKLINRLEEVSNHE